jgi:hypothetical protein
MNTHHSTVAITTMLRHRPQLLSLRSVEGDKITYRIVSGQSDEWRLLFFVRLAIELLTV